MGGRSTVPISSSLWAKVQAGPSVHVPCWWYVHITFTKQTIVIVAKKCHLATLVIESDLDNLHEILADFHARTSHKLHISSVFVLLEGLKRRKIENSLTTLPFSNTLKNKVEEKNSPLEILKKRYASGEMSEDEFNKMKENLE